MSEGQVAMVVGVGGGLGAALGRRFAQAGIKVGLVASVLALDRYRDVLKCI